MSSRPLTIFSEGTRLAADVFAPAGDGPATRRPAILLCHGWGGLKSQLAEYARAFARAGFLAMTFDYRGWGESDGRIIPVPGSPRLLEAGVRTLDVRVLREIVDPVDQTTDVANCLAALVAEPGVDPARIGVWGTSYGGGHAVFVGGNDDRIRAIVAQIGGFDYPPEYRAEALLRATEKARGQIEPVVPQDGLDAAAGLKGTPDIARMAVHSRLAAAAHVRVPTLIMDAEHEELVDRLEHGFAAYTIVRQHATSEYRTFPCDHYAVYNRFFDESVAAAIEWFHTYL
ncbi:MAG: alpha/beta fold hydrolase [Candidatus Eremiobacteraeota bacterium]|nr:alpha/beta fold hydrolase [Candidatus Eremiobacteraeota bacterium]